MNILTYLCKYTYIYIYIYIYISIYIYICLLDCICLSGGVRVPTHSRSDAPRIFQNLKGNFDHHNLGHVLAIPQAARSGIFVYIYIYMYKDRYVCVVACACLAVCVCPHTTRTPRQRSSKHGGRWQLLLRGSKAGGTFWQCHKPRTVIHVSICIYMYIFAYACMSIRMHAKFSRVRCNIAWWQRSDCLVRMPRRW